MLMITPFYAALLTFLYIFLSIRTLRQRHVTQVALGDGNDKQLLRKVRVHGNFAEYVPLALIMTAFAETLEASPIILHILCLSLLVGRLSHAFGVSHQNEDYKYRVAGMAMTLGSLGLSATTILVILGINVA